MLAGASSIAEIVGWGLGFLLGVTIHEFAHAWTAYRLGDTLAYYQGRVTLDPRSHIDPIGLILAVIVGFGWGRPVPVNPNAFYPNEQRGLMIVSLAGPLTNLALASVIGALYRIISGGVADSFIENVLFAGFAINVILFVFNLIPLSPLDGWKIMLGLLPREQSAQIARYERESFLVLILVVIVGTHWILLGPLVRFLFDALIL
ncbi:MAG: site-2 protease family protein [Chloroflexi bacterium]|nr:site-2 protease family protein [Chloroflexota bacterium]